MEKTRRRSQSNHQISLGSLNEVVGKENEVEDSDDGWDTDLGSDGLLLQIGYTLLVI